MANVIKSATTVSNGTIKQNNFLIGVNTSVDYGPTSTTGFWNGIVPSSGGYTVYAQKSSQGPSIRTAASDSELITIATQYGGTNINNAYDAITYFSGQSNYLVTNIDYPNIVTSGLSLILDTGYTPSSPITGKTWEDLSGNDYNGTLTATGATSGPIYSTGSGGILTFSAAAADYVYMYTGGTGPIIATDNFTIDIWCKPTGTITNATEASSGFGAISGQRFVTEPVFASGPTSGTSAGAGVSVGTNGIVVAQHANSYIPAILSYNGTISSTSYSNITITYTSRVPKAYLNGTLVRTGLTSGKVVNLTIGLLGGMQYGYFDGGIAIIKYYNRTLSTTEITQNYNAMSPRFA